MKLNHTYTLAVVSSMFSLLSGCSKGTYQFAGLAPESTAISQLEVSVPDHDGGGGGGDDGVIVVNPPPVHPPVESSCGSWETVISASSLKSVKICNNGVCLNPSAASAATAVHADSLLNSEYEYKLVVKNGSETTEMYPKIAEFFSSSGEKKSELSFKLQELRANRILRISAKSIERDEAHVVQDVQLSIAPKSQAPKMDLEKDMQLARLDLRAHSEKIVPNFSLQVRRCN